MNINQQKSTEKNWYNEAKEPIPYNRTTPFERSSEKTLARLAKEAVAINERLIEYKASIIDKAQELYELFLAENGGQSRGKGKGNALFYNFDRSLKVEVAINEQITFDENTIELAKAKLDDFLTANTTGIDAIIKELIMSAFETSRGRLDTKKVLSLKRHASRINDALFTEAVNLIDKAIRRPESRTYFRVWIKDENGKYQNVDLNFSSI